MAKVYLCTEDEWEVLRVSNNMRVRVNNEFSFFG